MAYVAPLGWAAKTGLILYSAPIIIWGLGTAEGAVRTALNGVASLFSRLSNHPEKSQIHYAQMIRHGGITLSCAAFTGVSLIPVVGTVIGYGAFRNECNKYSKIKQALDKNKNMHYLKTMTDIIQRLENTPEITEMSLNNLYKKLNSSPSKNKVSRLENLNVPASLIYNYYGYSILYFAMEKTSDGLSFTARSIKNIALYLSRNNIIKRAAVCALNAIKNEVMQTLDDTVNNPRVKTS